MRTASPSARLSAENCDGERLFPQKLTTAPNTPSTSAVKSGDRVSAKIYDPSISVPACPSDSRPTSVCGYIESAKVVLASIFKIKKSGYDILPSFFVG